MRRAPGDKSDPVTWLEVTEVSDAPDHPSDTDAANTRAARSLPSAWYLAVLAVVVLLMAVGLIQRGRAASRNNARPSLTAAVPTTAPSSTHAEPPLPTPTTSTTVIDLHRPLLDVPAGLTLFARGADMVLRIQLSTGRITNTELPPLSSGGPTAFVAGADSVLVRPQDPVTGYRLIDGRPPVALDDQLITPGVVLPGPDSHHIWVQNVEGTSMRLVDFSGHPTGASVRVPVMADSAQSDGRGYLLFYDVGGVYEAGPSGAHRITTGSVLATGPTRFLVSECDDVHRCSTYVIDRTTGERRDIGRRLDLGYATGSISPDGSTAAILNFGPSSAGALQFVNLNTGAVTTSTVALGENNPDSGYSQLAWSPDSRWLFSSVSSTLVVLDRAGKVHPLGVRLPPVTQLAVRPLH